MKVSFIKILHPMKHEYSETYHIRYLIQNTSIIYFNNANESKKEQEERVLFCPAVHWAIQMGYFKILILCKSFTLCSGD